MANVLGTLFGDIADAIRSKTGDTASMKPMDFPSKIMEIEGGGSSVEDIIPEQEITFTLEDSVPTFYGNSLFNMLALTVGEEYHVLWGGEEFVCTAFETTFTNIPCVAIGNAVMSGGEDTGEPFAMGRLVMEGTDAHNHCIIASLDGSMTKTVRVYRKISNSGGSSGESSGVSNDAAINKILDEINGELIGETALKDLILDSGGCGGAASYRLNGEGTLVITGDGPITDNPWAELYADKVRTVSIDNGITEIGNTIFQSHEKLKIVLLPHTITSIGLWAFASCKNLTTVNRIPSSVTTIMYHAFAGCTNLSYVALEETTGWKVRNKNDVFINLPESIAEDPAQVAVCLRETYKESLWLHEE